MIKPEEAEKISAMIKEFGDLMIGIQKIDRPITPKRAEYYFQNMERIAVQLKMLQSNPYGDLDENYLEMIRVGLKLAEELKQSVMKNLRLSNNDNNNNVNNR